MGTKIEWVRGADGKAGETWNPASGCSKVGLGCLQCYAERLSKRIYQGARWKPWTERNINTNLRIHPHRLRDPFRWYEPRKIFVCSMGDLFHGHLPHAFVLDVFGIMGAAWWHTFMVLTKRPERMCGILTMCAHEINDRVLHWTRELFNGAFRARKKARLGLPPWPLPNVIPGTSLEDQRSADERILHLHGTAAAVRFISIEPMLGPIDLKPYFWPTCWHWDSNFRTPEEALAAGAFAQLIPQALVSANRNFIDWVIVGGESGPKARPADLDWFRNLRDQCLEAGVPYFLKQLGTAWARKVGAKSYKGSDPEEWPEDLRVREMPK